ncbi:unnamed protein product [Linum trigynum]|uniref:Transposase n=1 Tax=Linum trigynum TaxID=586398 RepID=A0AAV2DDB5_9ROSI
MMDTATEVPIYVGGDVDRVQLLLDQMSYFELVSTLIEDLDYSSVERVWYLTPGQSMEHGLHEIRTDADVINGLLVDAELGEVSLFFEATKFIHEMGDNYGHSEEVEDEEGDNSAVAEFVRIDEDDAQTSDEEYHEIQARYRRMLQRSRLEETASREEVDQLFVDPNEVNEPVQPSVNVDEEAADGHGEEVQQSGDMGDDEAQGSEATVYRGSENSDHVRGNIGEEEEVSMIDKCRFYDPKCDHKTLLITTHMRFASPEQFKEAITRHSIEIGADIRWVRSSQKKKEVVCAQNCGWRVYASWYGKRETFIVKGVGTPHDCPRSFRNRGATAKWIATEYLERFRVDQDWNVNLMAAEIKQKHNLDVTRKACYRARIEARRILHGTLQEDFHRMRSYVGHLQKVDPDGTFLLEVDLEPESEKVYFKRFYVGFSSLSRGFLEGCRPFFCLDGCFLKGEVKGMLLSAVGKDGNNHMYPIAWAVVESENGSSWTWFIQTLKEQLHIVDGNCWTIVSDQQKGLVDAIHECLPHAEHRKCARHVHAHFKAKHRFDMATTLYWEAVYSTNEPDWKAATAKLKDLGGTVYQDFMAMEPERFC